MAIFSTVAASPYGVESTAKGMRGGGDGSGPVRPVGRGCCRWFGPGSESKQVLTFFSSFEFRELFTNFLAIFHINDFFFVIFGSILSNLSQIEALRINRVIICQKLLVG